MALPAQLNRLLGPGKFIANHMQANQSVRIQPADMETGNKRSGTNVLFYAD